MILNNLKYSSFHRWNGLKWEHLLPKVLPISFLELIRINNFWLKKENKDLRKRNSLEILIQKLTIYKITRFKKTKTHKMHLKLIIKKRRLQKALKNRENQMHFCKFLNKFEHLYQRKVHRNKLYLQMKNLILTDTLTQRNSI